MRIGISGKSDLLGDGEWVCEFSSNADSVVEAYYRHFILVKHEIWDFPDHIIREFCFCQNLDTIIPIFY